MRPYPALVRGRVCSLSLGIAGLTRAMFAQQRLAEAKVTTDQVPKILGKRVADAYATAQLEAFRALSVSHAPSSPWDSQSFQPIFSFLCISACDASFHGDGAAQLWATWSLFVT